MSDPSISWRARVRVYECDRLGHVNNAVYLHYLQQATAEAWASLGAPDWELRSLAMEYLAPAHGGDELDIRAWTDGADGALRVCSYDIVRASDGRVILRARAAWTAPREDAGAPILPAWSSAPVELVRVAPLRLPPDRLDAHRYCWRHAVRSYELDATGNANPAHVLRWVEEARMVACAEAGWSLDRMLAADMMVVQIRRDSEFYTPLRLGEQVEVVSRVYELRFVKGTWCHEIYRLPPASAAQPDDKELIARDYSAGGFLTSAGRPNPAPKAVLHALVRGAEGQGPQDMDYDKV